MRSARRGLAAASLSVPICNRQGYRSRNVPPQCTGALFWHRQSDADNSSAHKLPPKCAGSGVLARNRCSGSWLPAHGGLTGLFILPHAKLTPQATFCNELGVLIAKIAKPLNLRLGIFELKVTFYL